MQCNKPGCKQNFHVTCAQRSGFLCEEAGNDQDSVKYCGYCDDHYQLLLNRKKAINETNDNFDMPFTRCIGRESFRINNLHQRSHMHAQFEEDHFLLLLLHRSEAFTICSAHVAQQNVIHDSHRRKYHHQCRHSTDIDVVSS